VSGVSSAVAFMLGLAVVIGIVPPARASGCRSGRLTAAASPCHVQAAALDWVEALAGKELPRHGRPIMAGIFVVTGAA
jgi:hypothetical protein